MFQVDENRYKNMQFRKVGDTGLKLPVITLGLAYNFSETDYEKSKELVLRAFNMGINSFDLSMAFGKRTGEIEKLFGRIVREDLTSLRNEIVISTKVAATNDSIKTGALASKKNIIQSVNASLARLSTGYIDVLYIDGFDNETPVEETAAALKLLVNDGKVLYVGTCNYTGMQVKKVGEVFKKYDLPYVGNMVEYNIFNRQVENDKTIDLTTPYGATIVYRPLAEGLLSNKYIKDAPMDSRANKSGVGKLDTHSLTVETSAQLTKLNTVAAKRGQSIAQLAISWVLRNPNVSSTVVGISKITQLTENIGAISKTSFDSNDLKTIDKETK